MSTEANVEVISKVNCGFCMTGNHTSCCIKTSPFWSKIWVCPCECDKSLVVKPKPNKDWFSKYREPFNKVTSEGKKKKAATNISAPVFSAPPKPYVPPKPRNSAIDALANEMLDDVRESDEIKAEKEKWGE